MRDAFIPDVCAYRVMVCSVFAIQGHRFFVQESLIRLLINNPPICLVKLLHMQFFAPFPLRLLTGRNQQTLGKAEKALVFAVVLLQVYSVRLRYIYTICLRILLLIDHQPVLVLSTCPEAVGSTGLADTSSLKTPVAGFHF